MTFKQHLDVFTGMTGVKDNLVKFNASLGVAMSKTLSLTVGVIDTYNSQVPTGIAKNDLGIFTGITVKLGK